MSVPCRERIHGSGCRAYGKGLAHRCYVTGDRRFPGVVAVLAAAGDRNYGSTGRVSGCPELPATHSALKFTHGPGSVTEVGVVAGNCFPWLSPVGFSALASRDSASQPGAREAPIYAANLLGS